MAKKNDNGQAAPTNPHNDPRPVVGIDLGGTNMQFGVVDAEDNIIGRTKLKTKANEGADAVIGRLAEGVGKACDEAGLTLDDISAVGLAAAGAVDIPNGVILNSPNLGWVDLPLRDTLQEKLDARVVLENDVNGAVWGEYMLGGAKGRGDVLGVWIGTGVGGGLVINGRLHHGELFTAGEIGHTVLDIHADKGQYKLEEVCSRTGMSRTIAHRLHAYPDSVMHEVFEKKGGVAGSKHLARAYEAGDELTVGVVDEAAHFLGIAIANQVTMLAMNQVIVGGGVTEALGQPFVDRIRASFDRYVFPSRCRDCRMMATVLEDNAGLFGAALLAREALAND